MGRPWSAVLELGLGMRTLFRAWGPAPKGKMVRRISEGVYSGELLGAKTEIPVYETSSRFLRATPSVVE